MSIDYSKIITAEMKAEDAARAAQDKANAEARAYLASTDWYVIRLQETGQAIPEDVLNKRADARVSVISRKA